MVSDHNAIKLELNNKSHRKYTNNWRLNNTLLNDQWDIEEIREEIKKFLEFNENEHNLSETLGHSKCTPKKNVYSHDAYIKNTRRSKINDLMLYLKFLEKQEKGKLKISRREIIKIRAQKTK
jgi:hypothetical protein